MQAWVERDSQGREYLVRTGTGVVTAVAAVGIVDDESDPSVYRVEIYCDAPHGRPGAIRYSTHPLVDGGSPLMAVARDALADVWPIVWTVQWHRHAWIPDDLPIGTLNLVTDARSVLTSLDPVGVPEPIQAAIPDYVPLHWGEGRP